MDGGQLLCLWGKDNMKYYRDLLSDIQEGKINSNWVGIRGYRGLSVLSGESYTDFFSSKDLSCKDGDIYLKSEKLSRFDILRFYDISYTKLSEEDKLKNRFTNKLTKILVEAFSSIGENNYLISEYFPLNEAPEYKLENYNFGVCAVKLRCSSWLAYPYSCIKIITDSSNWAYTTWYFFNGEKYIPFIVSRTVCDEFCNILVQINRTFSFGDSISLKSRGSQSKELRKLVKNKDVKSFIRKEYCDDFLVEDYSVDINDKDKFEIACKRKQLERKQKQEEAQKRAKERKDTSKLINLATILKKDISSLTLEDLGLLEEELRVIKEKERLEKEKERRLLQDLRQSALFFKPLGDNEWLYQVEVEELKSILDVGTVIKQDVYTIGKDGKSAYVVNFQGTIRVSYVSSILNFKNEICGWGIQGFSINDGKVVIDKRNKNAYKTVCDSEEEVIKLLASLESKVANERNYYTEMVNSSKYCRYCTLNGVKTYTSGNLLLFKDFSVWMSNYTNKLQIGYQRIEDSKYIQEIIGKAFRVNAIKKLHVRINWRFNLYEVSSRTVAALSSVGRKYAGNYKSIDDVMKISTQNKNLTFKIKAFNMDNSLQSEDLVIENGKITEIDGISIEDLSKYNLG